MHKQSPLRVMGRHTHPQTNQCLCRFVCVWQDPNALETIPEEEDERTDTQGTDDIQAHTHTGGVGCNAGPACSQLI